LFDSPIANLSLYRISIEKAELQLPFVPTSSKREGWVIFSKDPAKADTVIGRVVSFKKP
jgi:uncharacterized protein (TIGR02588 family)